MIPSARKVGAQPVFPIALNCPKVTTTSTGRSETGETESQQLWAGATDSSGRVQDVFVNYKYGESLSLSFGKGGDEAQAGRACLAGSKLGFSSGVTKTHQ